MNKLRTLTLTAFAVIAFTTPVMADETSPVQVTTVGTAVPTASYKDVDHLHLDLNAGFTEDKIDGNNVSIGAGSGTLSYKTSSRVTLLGSLGVQKSAFNTDFSKSEYSYLTYDAGLKYNFSKKLDVTAVYGTVLPDYGAIAGVKNVGNGYTVGLHERLF